jgi:hypothetical protein
MSPMDDGMHTVEADREWKVFYRIGGVAALVAAFILRRWLSAEYMLLRGVGLFTSGPTSLPKTVVDWFQLLQDNRLLGLTLLNSFDLANYALVGIIFFALYGVLRKEHQGLLLLAGVLTVLGVGVHFASNQAFGMLSLSTRYASTADSAQRVLLLAAGQASLNAYDPLNFGTGIFWGFSLVTVAGLLFSIVMLRGNRFGRAAAWIGVVANVLGLGYFLTVAFASPLTFVPLSLSAPFLLVWYILVGLRLLRISSRRE